MREGQESRKIVLEVVVAVVGIIVAAACALSDAPRPSLAMPVLQVKEQKHQGQLIAEIQTAMQQLRTRNTAVETETVAITRLLQGIQAELASLKEGHTALQTQVTTTVAKLQQLETAIQQTNKRVANSVDPKALLQVTKERDEALAQSKQSDDQVRQLTLKLQKAGVFP
jgi:septal ring factor EnvC (AmiA/AmiB activator)